MASGLFLIRWYCTWISDVTVQKLCCSLILLAKQLDHGVFLQCCDFFYYVAFPMQMLCCIYFQLISRDHFVLPFSLQETRCKCEWFVIVYIRSLECTWEYCAFDLQYVRCTAVLLAVSRQHIAPSCTSYHYSSHTDRCVCEH